MKILLPVDNSSCSKATVEWACQQFNNPNNEYYLLFCITVLPEIPVTDLDIEQADAILETYKTQLSQQGFSQLKSEVLMGDPVEQICLFADSIPVDMVVMGSHARTGLPKFLMGSTSISVLEHCKQPVVIYKSPTTIEKKHEPKLNKPHIEKSLL